MKLLACIQIAVFLTLNTASVSAQTLRPASKEILQKILSIRQQFVDYYKGGNLKALGDMYDESYMIIRANGQIANKDVSMKVQAATMPGLKQVSYSDEQVFMAGDNIIAIAIYHVAGNVEGKDYDVTARAMDLFVKKEGKWIVTFSTITPLLGKPSAVLPSVWDK